MESVTVIISHLNSARTIERCLDSILSQNYYPISVIVIDGGSNDDSIEIVQKYVENTGVVEQIIVEGCSEAEGQIIGIKEAKTEIIFFTNSDIYVPYDWISKHLAWQKKGYDLIGGSVFWSGDKYAFAWNTFKTNKTTNLQAPALGLGFSNCSTTKTAIQKAGGLKNLCSQQDTEFSFQLIRRGLKMILDPKIQVYHDHPFKNFLGSFKRAFGYSKNHVLVLRSVYGRLVYGSGYPITIYLGIPLEHMQKMNPAKTYYQYKNEGEKFGIKINILEFMFLKIFAQFCGQMTGAIAGALKRNPDVSLLLNLHPQRALSEQLPRLEQAITNSQKYHSSDSR